MNLKGKLIALVMGTAAAGIAFAAPANAAPTVATKATTPAAYKNAATEAMAFVIPSNCFQSATYHLRSVDGSGNTVDANAVAVGPFWDYSTSGASVALNSIQVAYSDNGHSWLADSQWKWGTQTHTGISLPSNGSPVSWDPGADYWQTVASHPPFSAHWYDANRPSVGVTAIILPCNY